MDSGHVRLRPWHPNDVPELVRLANNRRVSDQLRDVFPYQYTAETGRAWVAHANDQSPVTHFAVECGGVLVGGVGYTPGRDIERCGAEVGYWVGEPYRGRGQATDALLALIESVRARGGCTRLFALPFASNAASRRVLEKAGFGLDAVLRYSAIKHGRVLDQCLYSLILTDDDPARFS
jgi:RimJ/RimL family protein N-acetyltransferase